MSTSPPPPPLFLTRLASSPALPTLPNEVVVSILARISKSYYSYLCLVSKSFYALLSSPDIYTARSEIRAKEPRLYMYLRLPEPKKNRLFTVGGELCLALVRLSTSYAPARLNSTCVSVGSEIYEIGGGNLSRAVRVFDCRSNTWRSAPRLKVARKNAKSCFLDGKIYVIGGREDDSMIMGEVFDVKNQTWNPLPSLVDENVVDSNLQVVVLEGRLNVITKLNKYVYVTEQGRWLRDVWYNVGIEVMNGTNCCVMIDNVMFGEIDGKYKWYNSSYGKWLVVENLDIVYVKRVCDHYKYKTLQLVNHGGKLVIIWHHWYKFTRFFENPYVSIWCAVIRLEKRTLTPNLETHIWGEVECCSNLFRACAMGEFLRGFLRI